MCALNIEDGKRNGDIIYCEVINIRTKEEMDFLKKIVENYFFEEITSIKIENKAEKYILEKMNETVIKIEERDVNFNLKNNEEEKLITIIEKDDEIYKIELSKKFKELIRTPAKKREMISKLNKNNPSTKE